ncbi:HtaA domain-containing protein [Streptomyces sp. QH1-20]|uniref:HtaA domain-containing protein n=1 Tax=Streptomyces sp. QH1-20 TaxID=3240934 RepID=UPI0035127817
MLPSRPARAPVTVLLAVLSAVLLPPAVARAAERHEVSGGRLDWGIKSSFQSYVTGPVAQGSWELREGAATVGDSRFRFHSARGSYDPDTGDFEAGFSGAVHFTGHKKPDGSHELDLTISRPTVRIKGGNGTLHADMTSKAKGTGRVTTATDVPFASLDLTGVNLRGGGTAVTLAGIPATLTARGAEAFAGYYTAGTPLDPVALSADVVAAKPTPSAAPSATEEEKEKPSAKGDFTGAAVDWGVRRTFREYVTGSIAQGSWKLGDGAQDGGALFRFPHGKGSYDRGSGDDAPPALDAAFAGTLRFTGKDLDLALSGVRVAVKDGKGTLTADVTRGGASPEKAVALVTFDAGKLTEKDGLASVTEAPAKLTAAGAKAFGGMYQEGADMDPLSLAVPLDATAKLPPLPDLGSGPKPSREAGAKPRTEPVAEAGPSSSFPVLPVTAAGAGALLVAAVTVAVVRKRRATAAASSPSPAEPPAPRA